MSELVKNVSELVKNAIVKNAIVEEHKQNEQNKAKVNAVNNVNEQDSPECLNQQQDTAESKFNLSDLCNAVNEVVNDDNASNELSETKREEETEKARQQVQEKKLLQLRLRAEELVFSNKEYGKAADIYRECVKLQGVAGFADFYKARDLYRLAYRKLIEKKSSPEEEASFTLERNKLSNSIITMCEDIVLFLQNTSVHRNTSVLYHNLAKDLQEQQAESDARIYFEKAAEYYEMYSKHKERAECLQSAINICVKNKEYNQLAILFEQAALCAIRSGQTNLKWLAADSFIQSLWCYLKIAIESKTQNFILLEETVEHHTKLLPAIQATKELKLLKDIIRAMQHPSRTDRCKATIAVVEVYQLCYETSDFLDGIVCSILTLVKNQNYNLKRV